MNIIGTWIRLNEKRWKLVEKADIPDMAYYSRQWAALALGYRMIGHDCMAATCEKNADRYGQMAGTWRRVSSGAYVELEYVP